MAKDKKKNATLIKTAPKKAVNKGKTSKGNNNTQSKAKPPKSVKSTARQPCKGKSSNSKSTTKQNKSLDNKSVAKPPRKNNTNKVVVHKGRTADGKIPKGRTLSTHDKYLPKNKHSIEQKDNRPLIVIETNKNNDLAVVPTSSRQGKNRTHIKNYQQGQTYFKHFVEIEDDEGKPIRINDKFRENHPNMDVSEEDIERIRKKVLKNSAQAVENQEKLKKFRGK